MLCLFFFFFFSSRRRHTRLFRVTGVQTCALPICGSDWKPQPSFVKLADHLPEDSRWTPAVRWLAHDLTIFPNAGEAFAYQIKHNFRGHPCNTLGVWYPRSVWFHFPVLLTIKLTLVTLGLTAGL